MSLKDLTPDAPAGGLVISNKTGGTFDQEDAEFAAAVAAQLTGTALLNP